MCKKKILYIINNYSKNNLEYLEKYFNIELCCLCSNYLIDKDHFYLNNLIESFDIIIIGGGPQHLIGNYLDIHPEIKNQIELVKILSKTNKILIGICLGCQIIGRTFDLEINQMDKLCLGFNYLDTNSIDHKYIAVKNDKYLSKMDFNLLSKSLSNHYDYVNFYNCSNSELQCVGYSNFGVPYILTHSTANIYGFQFHPEVTFDSIVNILNTHPNFSIELLEMQNCHDVYIHFFNIFINS